MAFMKDMVKMRTKSPWRVLFFGSDEFSVKVLDALHQNSLSGKTAVVDQLDIVHPQSNKPTPVSKYAALFNLRGYEWPLTNINDFLPYDVGVVASFGHLIPKKVVEAFSNGIVNVHPSLLPRWRGAAPLQHTILNGDLKTGVSIMLIKPKHFDIGPLLNQQDFDVSPHCSVTSLRDYLALEGGKMTIDILSHLPEALRKAVPQSAEGVTYAHKITLPMSFIDWENQTMDSIDRQYRALHDITNLRTQWEGMTVRMVDMLNARAVPGITLDPASPPGLPVFDKITNALWVRCKDGWMGFSSVVIKKKMSAKSFHNGYLTKKHLKGIIFKSLPNHLFDDAYDRWIKQTRPS